MTSPSQLAGSLAAAVVQGSVDGFAVIDREGRYTLWNPAMERFAGKPAAEVLGRRVLDVFPYLSERGVAPVLERVLRGENIASDGIHHVEPDGTRRVYDNFYLPMRDDRGEITGVIAIVRDATARYAAQEALSTTETKLLMAAEAAGIGLWSWDPATDVIIWEDTMCGLYGRPTGYVPKGRDEYIALIHPDDREVSRQRIARGRSVGHWEHEYRIIRPDGALRWLVSRTRIVHTDRGELVLGAVYDVTDRREMEERQRATQRLEVVGQLTAGIAHNFNNLLMGILPTLELASRTAPTDLLPLLRVAEQSAQRAASVVRQLMTYAAARKDTASRRTESMALLVERVATFCRTTFDRGIALEVLCGESGAAADVDPSQIEQAVLNLLINARDAVEGAAVAAPKIRIVVETLTAGAPELEGRAGDWVAIRVVDNGVGMDAATIQRMYEPFFTTKAAGKGTGLGLATTHAIVRDHGGFVTCRSEPGRGTTFTLHIPRSERALSPAVAEQGTSDGARARPVDAAVLVVDDDEAVRGVVRRILEGEGFRVETAVSGDEALERMADAAKRVDLVLLDVSMPGTSGAETRRRMREMVPRVPVVFLTGYDYRPEAGDAVLQKPVSQGKLVSCLREILSGG